MKALLEQLQNSIVLRGGILTILLILSWVAWHDMEAHNREAELARDQLKSSLIRYQQASSAPWVTRSTEATLALREEESNVWHFPTAGVAQARLYDLLRTELDRIKAVRPRITLKEEEVDRKVDKATSNERSDHCKLNTCNVVKYSVSIDFDPDKLRELLHDIEGMKPYLRVDALDIDHSGKEKVEMLVTAYYLEKKS
ncbi:hypothetical protein KSF73_03285 [Burkholderiaceae bacterium DAT-1]|nr:hypothetical protein [Burkholderiaceae bacterium DAT-1]